MRRDVRGARDDIAKDDTTYGEMVHLADRARNHYADASSLAVPDLGMG